ncbi:protein CEPU-1-like [Stylophora pistillata]|uniref:protein CEPU-1-like n=1 Tax=Stylophora pistillata TaxID=50429 RepID=UPI000C04A748|nr:protein CEPU-1-like [Stylophora pistillata]
MTFFEPPQIVTASKKHDVCEGSMVTLSCNATGKPPPNITWTRVWENGADSKESLSVDGYLVIHNITRTSSGTYRCTAFNGVGDPVNQTMEVIVGTQTDESDIESKGSRDASSFGEDVEISSFENESEDSASASASSGESFASVDEDDESDEE